MNCHSPFQISLWPVNAFLLRGERGDVLVDTGMPGQWSGLQRGLNACGSSVERLAAIILTHAHFDHTGSLAAIRRRSQAPILAHRLEAPILESGEVVLPAGATPIARLLMAAGAPIARFSRFPSITPDVVVDDDFSLRPWGIPGRLIHTPAHTRGSLTVLLASGDAVVGDLCQNAWGFGMGRGRIFPPLADVPESLGRSWDRVIAEGARRVWPGHGKVFSVADLQEARERLRRKIAGPG